MSAAIKGYEDDAAALIPKYEALSPAVFFTVVSDFLPDAPARVLDIGAGTGNVAAWLASQKHSVVAVEPVAAFRNAAAVLHRSSKLTWINDTLPELDKVLATRSKFDLIVLSAVWQHLDEDQREAAFARLRMLTNINGRIIMSLRHGVGAATRPVHPIDVGKTRALACRNHFRVLYQAETFSIQEANRQADVTWTWLVLEAQR